MRKVLLNPTLCASNLSYVYLVSYNISCNKMLMKVRSSHCNRSEDLKWATKVQVYVCIVRVTENLCIAPPPKQNPTLNAVLVRATRKHNKPSS